jgi:hypothetical protein
MNFVRAISAVVLLGSLGGCYPPTQSAYSPAVWEQPQPVHFFYGRLVAIRPAEIAYGGPAGVGLRLRPAPWYLAGVGAGATGPSGGVGVAALGAQVFFEASIPNVPASEYTVMLDRGSNPPDPYLDPRERTAAIIIVQNVYPFERAPQLNEHVAVRVVGNSARIIADALPPDVELRLAAAAPMPVPLSGQSVSSPPPSAQSYGYQRYYQHWTIEP